MKLISTSWSCNRCGAAFISTPPDPTLCEGCASEPGSSGWTHPRGYDAHLDTLRCQRCGALPMSELKELLRAAYELGMEAAARGEPVVLSDWPAGYHPTRRTQPGGDPS